jgi:hypothetical protein
MKITTTSAAATMITRTIACGINLKRRMGLSVLISFTHWIVCALGVIKQLSTVMNAPNLEISTRT